MNSKHHQLESSMSKKILVLPCVAIGMAALLGTASARADEETKMSGRLYADFTSVDAKSNGVKTSATGMGLDVKRAYVGIDHKFDDMWSANVTTDFQYVSNDSVTNVYIKKAYVQAKISDAFVIRAGSADTPWVPFVEGLYGYRFLENVIIDKLKFGTSADWGLNVAGKGGMFNYSASLLNGGGYKNPTRTKTMDVEGRAAVTPIDGLTVAVGIYSGKRAQKVEGGAATPNTANRFDALVAYVKGGARFGAEYFTAKNWNNVLGATADDKTDGISVWGSYDFSPKWGVFARGDSAKLSKDLNPGRKDKYFNVGFISHARKNVDIAFAFKNDKLSGGTGAEVKTNEVGLWAQVNL
jgi:hypothetical protein